MTSKTEFASFIIEHCPLSARVEPRIETDGVYKYECYDDASGHEVAFISWRGGQPTYVVHR